MNARRKVRNSIVSSWWRCSSWRLAQRGETGKSRAHQALRLEARAGDDHVGPVGHERIDRGVQGADLALQLGDEVLLVATLAGLSDDLVS